MNTTEIIDPAHIIMTGAIFAGLSGVPGLFPRLGATVAQKLATIIACLGSLLGLGGAIVVAVSGMTEHLVLDWSLPFGPCDIWIDPLAAFFLIPIFLVSGACAVYANGYWPAGKHPGTSRVLGFFLGLLASSMVLLITAGNSVFFLISWEVMAVSAYFAITAENEDHEVRKAGFVYLVCTHVGTLALFVMFIVLRLMTGSFAIPHAGTLSPLAPGAAVIFFTAIFGFGMKAGIMPLHIWLPAAHANGPSHVSAMMSGVMLKMGIYGIIRIVSLFSPIPLWWGVVILGAGIVSGLAGVISAIGQHDLKRLLAYSSIENIGIITIGLGTALIGMAVGHPPLVIMGMGGCLLHMLNHSLFKSLLFLGSGAVIHATGTRELSRMGGLARHMPRTALLFFIGCVAICGLPPLNGFVSEYLLYFGFFNGINGSSIPVFSTMVLAIFSLALIGSLALACFVRLCGIAFLGQNRSSETGALHDAPLTMVAPMALLALCCLGVGLLPLSAVHLVEIPVLAVFPPAMTAGKNISSIAPLAWLEACGLLLTLVIVAFIGLYLRRLKANPPVPASTWGCGYLQPTARIQYSATSFAEMLVHFFRGVLQPRYAMPRISGFLPNTARFSSRIPETVLEGLLLPFMRLTGLVFSFLRRLQHGEPNLYVLYIFVTLVMMLAWSY
ncbi:proton-conducting transporter membrane subunit [Geotalea sp. SG265]|uniref:proton-conducting transporter transmembrane domain-containing protein n=1 Tax=Geotalea sp. SG265 TaxID=2922867 RepID=UPI001FAEF69D|nr:proton-conducting transporter membrane subunit [Geotalea sp. SG265]